MSTSLVSGEPRAGPAPGVASPELSKGRITSVPCQQHCSSHSPGSSWWGFLPQGQTVGPWSVLCLGDPHVLSVKLCPAGQSPECTGARGCSLVRDCALRWNLMRFLSVYCSGILCEECIDFFRKGDKIKKNNSRSKCCSIFHKNSTRFFITVPRR